MKLESPLLSSPPSREAAQELHSELIRHYADVLCMLAARIPFTPTAPAAVDSAPEVRNPVPETSEEPPDPSSDWESAVTLLERRDWHSETIVHLWLRPSYVLGLHVLIGVGVSLRGHRRMVTVTECGPQDQACMEPCWTI